MPPIATVLVTGASGFIGSALVAFLAKDDKLSVKAATRGTDYAFPECVKVYPGFDFSVETDWSSALTGVDCIIHTIARAHVMHDTASDALAEFRRINVEGSLSIARQAAALGVRRFIFLSSIKANGERTIESPFTAEAAPAPEDAYGVSKLEAERGLAELGLHTGLEIVVLRPSLVYGPGVKGNFLRLLQAVDCGIPLPFALTKNRRSLIYLDNLTSAIGICLTHPAAAGKTYLVSDGEDVSTAELISRIAQALGKPSRLWPFPLGLMELAGMMTGKSDEIARLLGSLCIDSSKIRNELDWTPPYTLEQGLAETAQWLHGQNNHS